MVRSDEINDFFISVSSHLPPFNSSILATLTVDYTDQYIIEPAYVEYQLSRVNIHKSSGPDGVPNWLLKEFAPLVCDPVAAIFNASVREGYVPLIWKSAEVIPAPKVNPPISIQNDLRPISLLPTLAKVLENIVGRWLLPFLEPHFATDHLSHAKAFCRNIFSSVLQEMHTVILSDF